LVVGSSGGLSNVGIARRLAGGLTADSTFGGSGSVTLDFVTGVENAFAAVLDSNDLIVGVGSAFTSPSEILVFRVVP
jgi:hypothetical protein